MVVRDRESGRSSQCAGDASFAQQRDRCDHGLIYVAGEEREGRKHKRATAEQALGGGASAMALREHAGEMVGWDVNEGEQNEIEECVVREGARRQIESKLQSGGSGGWGWRVG